MKCPNCSRENPVGKKFCRECGISLDLVCPQCGAEIAGQDKFCGECGLVLTVKDDGTSKRAVSIFDSERKHVSILFSDLSGYTAMTERLDPEEVKDVMSRIFGEIAQVITKYEGFIENFIGDAILAIFGIPNIFEITLLSCRKYGINITTQLDSSDHQDITTALEQI